MASDSTNGINFFEISHSAQNTSPNSKMIPSCCFLVASKDILMVQILKSYSLTSS